MRRLHVDEVDVHAVDLGHELRERVQASLDAMEVVFRGPKAGERLQRGELHSLRAIVDKLLGGPARRFDATAKLGELVTRELEMEPPDLG